MSKRSRREKRKKRRRVKQTPGQQRRNPGETSMKERLVDRILEVSPTEDRDSLARCQIHDLELKLASLSMEDVEVRRSAPDNIDTAMEGVRRPENTKTSRSPDKKRRRSWKFWKRDE